MGAGNATTLYIPGIGKPGGASGDSALSLPAPLEDAIATRSAQGGKKKLHRRKARRYKCSMARQLHATGIYIYYKTHHWVKQGSNHTSYEGNMKEKGSNSNSLS